MKCQDVIDNARDALSDPDEVAFTDGKLLSYLNQALLALINVRPDAHVVTGAITLAAGSMQSLPAGGLRLMALRYNASVSNAPIAPPIRRIEGMTLDEVLPSWLSDPTSASCYEYWYDEKEPRRFWTNNVQAGTKAIGTYATAPATITDPDTDLPVDVTFSVALQEWILYLAWRRDDETSPTAARAAVHNQNFYSLLGVKAKSEANASPNRNGG